MNQLNKLIDGFIDLILLVLLIVFILLCLLAPGINLIIFLVGMSKEEQILSRFITYLSGTIFLIEIIFILYNLHNYV